jgi:hypothetical protein
VRGVILANPIPIKRIGDSNEYLGFGVEPSMA